MPHEVLWRLSHKVTERLLLPRRHDQQHRFDFKFVTATTIVTPATVAPTGVTVIPW